MTPKIDGTSCLVTVSTEGIVNIYSRGNGTEGKLLNHLEQYIINSDTKQAIIAFLKKNRLKQFMCRGELIVSKTNFAKVSDRFKSARSLVNGISNKTKSISTETCSLLEFLVFEIIQPNLIPEEQFGI